MRIAHNTTIKDLNASEAHILVHGPPERFKSGYEVFEQSVLELVGRGWLDVRESPETLKSQSGIRFIRGKRDDVPKDWPLFATFRLFNEGFSGDWAPEDGLPVFMVWRALDDRYDGPDGYVDMEVLPSLRARGLYERSGSGIISMLMLGGWRRTRAGDRLRGELQNLLSEAQENFAIWVSKEPGKALDFFESSGVTLLLLPSLYDEVARLPSVRADETRPTPGELDPEVFRLLSAVFGVLDGSGRPHSDDWGGGYTGLGGLVGIGSGGDGGGDVGGGP